MSSGRVAGSGGASSFNQVWTADTPGAKSIKRVGPFMVTRTMGGGRMAAAGVSAAACRRSAQGARIAGTMPARISLLVGSALLAGSAALAQGPAQPGGTVPQPRTTRGGLLYETHCIACHNSQMHWRDARTVRDWAGLVAQVRNWQDRARLQWSEADILEVARHLNAAIYRLPQPAPVQGRGPAIGPGAPRS